jgi:hypothetical protein
MVQLTGKSLSDIVHVFGNNAITLRVAADKLDTVDTILKMVGHPEKLMLIQRETHRDYTVCLDVETYACPSNRHWINDMLSTLGKDEMDIDKDMESTVRGVMQRIGENTPRTYKFDTTEGFANLLIADEIKHKRLSTPFYQVPDAVMEFYTGRFSFTQYVLFENIEKIYTFYILMMVGM